MPEGDEMGFVIKQVDDLGVCPGSRKGGLDRRHGGEGRVHHDDCGALTMVVSWVIPVAASWRVSLPDPCCKRLQ